MVWLNLYRGVSMQYLITGGAGFIGSNFVVHLLKLGHSVTVFDNFSRAGTRENLESIMALKFKNQLRFVNGDIRDYESVKSAVVGAETILHLAGQVAVTASVTNPRYDFEVNSLGTLNLLEAARNEGNKPLIIFASTNKVYGGLEDYQVLEQESRYAFADCPYGVSENQPLDFHSPYGCSKGTADQYVHDYSRIYGIPTVVLRLSCIYGPRQFGMEDQGWVAWFLISAALGREINIYGDGKQVRDLLYIDDLIDAVDKIVIGRETLAGQIFNLGGGRSNSISVWQELQPMLESVSGKKLIPNRGDWRPGDQKIYISDIRKAEKYLHWTPKIKVSQGIVSLYQWIEDNRDLLRKVLKIQ